MPSSLPSDEANLAIEALVQELERLADVIRSCTSEQYPLVLADLQCGSLGGHVRHVVDHVMALLSAESETMTYDNRCRGTDVEYQVSSGLDAIRIAQEQLRAIQFASDRPLRVDAVVGLPSQSVAMSSSWGRELLFVLSHTIHHNAIVGVLARQMAIATPCHLGVAPSTLAARGAPPCAQ